MLHCNSLGAIALALQVIQHFGFLQVCPVRFERGVRLLGQKIVAQPIANHRVLCFAHPSWSKHRLDCHRQWHYLDLAEWLGCSRQWLVAWVSIAACLLLRYV